MKKVSLILLAILLGQLTLFAQKTDKQKVRSSRISMPEQYLENLTDISVSIEAGEVFLKEAQEALEGMGSASREALWLSTGKEGDLTAQYFSFPGYQAADNGSALKAVITLDQLKISGRELKEIQEEYKDGEEKKLRTNYIYQLTYSFPASLKVTRQGQVLLDEALSGAGAKRTISFGSDQFGSFTDEAALEKAYAEMEAVFHRVIERDVLLSTLMEARKKLENAFLFSYESADFTLYGAKGKKFDYAGLEKALEDAAAAFETYKKDQDRGQLLSTLETVTPVWEEELGQADPGDNKARINAKIGMGLCNNLAIAALYSGDLNSAAAWLEKAGDFGKPNGDVKQTATWAEAEKEHAIQGLDLEAMAGKILPAEESHKEISHPGQPRISTIVAKSRKPEQVVGYEELLVKAEEAAPAAQSGPAAATAGAVTAALSPAPALAVEGKALNSTKDIDPSRIRYWDAVGSTIIALGDKTIALTDDAAATWTIHNLPTDKARLVCFPSRQTGYVTTVKKGMFKTTDGGASWNAITAPEEAYFPQSIAFSDEQTGFVSDGMNKIYTTTDGGVSWTEFTDLHLGNVTGIEVIDASNIAILSTTRVYFSKDGGKTWTPTPSKDQTGATPHAAHFFIPEEGVLVGNHFRVLRTTDGAKTLTRVHTLSIDVGVTLTDVAFSEKSPELGIAIALQGMLVTSNSGLEWTDIKPSVKAALRVFFDGTGAFYVGAENGLWRSEDQGITITQVL